jgi:hypothetical protein
MIGDGMAPGQTTPTGGVEQAFADSFAIDPGKRYLLHNRTAEPITISDGEHGDVMLPPLAQRVVAGARIAPFEHQLRLSRQKHELRVRELTGPGRPTGHRGILVVGFLIAVTAAVAYDVFVRGTVVTWEAAGAVALLTAVVIYLAWRSIDDEKARVSEEADADVAEGDIEFGVGGTYYDGNEAARRTKQIFTLVAVIVIGAVLPAIAIFVATDAKDFLTIEDGLAVRSGMGSLLVSRLVQVVYTAVLALFPALMYFQFDRQRVGTIRGKWVRAIFRMDHRMKTLADVDARYGDELAEASSYSTDSVRFLGGRHSPIVIATILISLGWTVLVMATDSFDFAAASRVSAAATTVEQAADRVDVAAAGDDDTAAASAAAAAADEAATASAEAAQIAADATGVALPSTTTTEAPASQSAGQVIDTSTANVEAAAEQVADAEDAVQRPFFQLLVPTPSAAVMAFLGAYFFAVYLVLRGYFSGDLRPKLYNQITARLVTVVVLAYLMTVLYIDGSDNRAFLAAAFLAGVVPTTVLGRIGQFGSSLAGHWGAKKDDSWLGKEFAKAFGTPRSLTQVDGIDIFECARLESEGITDIPSLAKTDLVSMMVNTRLPIERLVDWTDQAVLILLLDDGGDEELDTRLTALRRLAVRTATNLMTVARSDPANPRRTTVEAILASGGQACPLDDLARQIEAEPSIQRVMQWYESERASVCDGGDGAGRGEPTAAALSPNGDGAPATTGGGTTGNGGSGVATGDGSNGDGSHGGDGDTAVVAWQLTMAGVRSAPAG